jgi:hypothetical protein
VTAREVDRGSLSPSRLAPKRNAGRSDPYTHL